ncbi:TetR/AcrR family transcriptional regulator [Streptomyces sp. NBC_00986]|uniref:TetR/AcrR family transcriptional regulator n=1 Tax=Streptomyces sp. NBC_00986 TaxID=2903702 RepID=UPI00386C68A8|nr:TetR/AcrR family transcriptional regulator [Streptomyces sp. NBC_00986]
MSKRDDMVTAAVDVFSRYGFRQTSMELLAQAAGVSRPALYLHFANKQDVFAAVAARVTDLMTAAAHRARDAEGTPADQVYGVLAVKLETAIGVTEARFRQELVSEAAGMGLTPVENGLVDALVELLAGIPEPRETAALLLAATVGIGQSDGTPEVLRGRLRRLVDLVMSGLDGEPNRKNTAPDLRNTPPPQRS